MLLTVQSVSLHLANIVRICFLTLTRILLIEIKLLLFFLMKLYSNHGHRRTPRDSPPVTMVKIIHSLKYPKRGEKNPKKLFNFNSTYFKEIGHEDEHTLVVIAPPWDDLVGVDRPEAESLPL